MKSQKANDLRPFFEPSAVAVIGSLAEPFGLGYGVIKNMLLFGFSGNVYPINPSYRETLGLKAYSTVNMVAEPIDLAVVITPPSTVPSIIEQCSQKGIRAVIVISEGFGEASKDGARLQQQLVDISRRTGIRIIGPNTVGLINTANGLVINPYLIDYASIRKGSIAYCSQTGIIGAQCQALEDKAYPISKLCDLGNKCDVNEVDILNYFADDTETKVIALHLEDVKDGRRFLEAARRTIARKPVLIMKPGRSEQAAKASASHTGSLTGSDHMYESAFKQVGAIRVNTWQEFWEIPKVFAWQPLPRGSRVAIITHSGGAGVVATDVAVEAGLEIATFTAATASKLRRHHPGLASNPVDLGPVSSLATDPISLEDELITTVLNDANVDCATIALYGGSMTPMSFILKMFDRLMHSVAKPVTIWVYGTKSNMMAELSHKLEIIGLPTYSDLEIAVKALGAAVYYARIKSGLDHT